MSRLYTTLLRARDAPPLQRACLAHLARRNLGAGEIIAHDIDHGHPRLALGDGTRLSAADDHALGPIAGTGLPGSHTACLAAYLLRYRFGHAFPERVIDTSPLPRRRYPAVVHRQHLNTLHDLPPAMRDEFLECMPVRHDDCILEVGSYIGFGTVQLSRATGPAGRVVSVEADPDAYTLLRTNVTQNGLNNVETSRFAVAGEDRTAAPFFRSGRQANSLRGEIVAGHRHEEVNVRSLATVLERMATRPTFMILTINGSELDALTSAADHLREHDRLRMVIPGWYRDRQGRLGERIVELLRSLGFRVAHTRGMQVFAHRAS